MTPEAKKHTKTLFGIVATIFILLAVFKVFPPCIISTTKSGDDIQKWVAWKYGTNSEEYNSFTSLRREMRELEEDTYYTDAEWYERFVELNDRYIKAYTKFGAKAALEVRKSLNKAHFWKKCKTCGKQCSPDNPVYNGKFYSEYDSFEECGECAAKRRDGEKMDKVYKLYNDMFR